eukprot:TRINITY_DN19891_c1_g3_i1.p1 TRINITY_DN19891_c1_g3~~TRINITY_DN19891_c1_g3_i1.p1  ORF type:complete len:362 (-),score=51.70 TRINITY_DN19891_c1_g3_i1:277-1248(-)
MLGGCTSAKIEQMCKSRPLRVIYVEEAMRPQASITERRAPRVPQAVMKERKKPSAPQLDTSDAPEVLVGPGSKSHQASWRQAATRLSKSHYMQEERDHASDPDNDKDFVAEHEKVDWTCFACTFVNYRLMTVCEMCELPAHNRTQNLVVQPPVEDRDSACAWPSLAQADHKGEKDWETLSSVSWLNIEENATGDDESGSVSSFMEVGDNFPKRHVTTDKNDSESVCSFLVVGEGDTDAATRTPAHTGAMSWAMRVAMTATPPAQAAKPSSISVRKARAMKPSMTTVNEEAELHDELSVGCTWGRRGYVHRGRQWQKHPRRCVV